MLESTIELLGGLCLSTLTLLMSLWPCPLNPYPITECIS